ncbi:ribonucleoside triphosphate reductase [Magnetococcales bacterium HHB-1]
MDGQANKTPRFVIKRNGSQIPFDAKKITAAITQAGIATHEFTQERAEKITAQVIKVLNHRFDTQPPPIEHIQDVVEQELISADFFKTARAYIVYREQHGQLRRDQETLQEVESEVQRFVKKVETAPQQAKTTNENIQVDVATSVNEYLSRADWRVTANANQGYSLGGLILNISGKMTANYWLSHVYPPEVGQAHRQGDYHIHDLDMLSGYCAGWSLRTLLNEGFNGVPGKVESLPPKHLSSALGQMVNFLGTLQNEWAGAQAFSSFDTYLAPFVRQDGLEFKQVRQLIQEFIYNLNVPSRWGTQTPFTNLTFDWVCPADLAEQVPLIGGKEVDYTYGDLQEEIDLINRAFLEVIREGDAKGRIFTFPIPTYNITPDFPWESENTNLLFEMTAKYGLPYFQNFVNSDLQPHMVRSMCCRLQLDLRELLKRGNGLFGSAEQTGSIGVVTLNCARLGFTAQGDWQALLQQTDHLLNLAKQSLEIKRKVIQRYIDGGLFPFTKRFLGTLRNHFSTIGVNGIHEMVLNFSQGEFGLEDDRGQKLACDFLDHLREQMVTFQTETGHMYNLEATPAEGAAHRFAREDKKRHPKIIQSGQGEGAYYTNSSQLPVGYSDDPFEVLMKQDTLQSKYTGGTVLHLYMSEQISSIQACKSLVKRVLTRFRLPYLTITPTFSICPVHGYIAGEHTFCPRCDEELLAKKKTQLNNP